MSSKNDAVDKPPSTKSQSSSIKQCHSRNIKSERKTTEESRLETPAAEKTITVNVNYCEDRWLVVSYENKAGETFHGILLKSGDQADAEIKREAISRLRSAKTSEIVRDGSLNYAQFSSINSNAGPEYSDEMSSVALRRSLSHFSDSPLDRTLTSKPFGIRRLENRSLRLRPTTSQRSTILCAKCQQQRVSLPVISRRFLSNPQSESGARPSVISSSASHDECYTASKRRSNQDSEMPSNAKRCKAGSEAGHPTASLPSSSRSSVSRQAFSDSKSSAVNGVESAPRIPKLKISFGNDGEKTTTIISLPVSTKSPGSKAHEASFAPGSMVGPMGPDCVMPGGDPFDHQEGTLLPNGLRVGDLVWAKMKSSPFWPARVFSANLCSACVTWCGSRQYGFVDFKAMEPFKEVFRKRYNPKRNAGYQKAVAEAIIKCSEGDGTNTYYQNVLSPLCWKYLTGGTTALVSSQRSAKGRQRQTKARTKRRCLTFLPSVADHRFSDDRKECTPSDSKSFSETFSNQSSNFDCEEEKSSDSETDDDLGRLRIDESINGDDAANPSYSVPAASRSDQRRTVASTAKVTLCETQSRTVPPHLELSVATGTADPHERHEQGHAAGGNRGSDDFDNVLTELQEMNELCAGTSVLAQC